MTTATQDIQAIRQHFTDNWLDAAPVIYSNQPASDLPEKTVWCRFSVRLGETFHGAGSSQTGILIQQGRAWLQVFIPSGTGDAAAFTLIDHFSKIYRNRRLDSSKIRFSTPDIDTSPQETDGYMMMTVSVPYESFRRYSVAN